MQQAEGGDGAEYEDGTAGGETGIDAEDDEDREGKDDDGVDETEYDEGSTDSVAGAAEDTRT